MASMLDVGDEPSSSAAMVLDDAPTTSMAAMLGGRLELPVERNAMEGVWMQATNYAQPDLHEDLTVEVDGGPLAEFAPAGTAVVSVAIVGDRNAGKSTFLHAFVNERDRDWLKVTSVLPAISGSFRNARYGTVGPCVPGGAPLAEAPYIDTDVACATAVLTIEDFAFFCNDFGLPDLLASVADASYVALRFVELGGDHLEALVNGPPPAASSLLLAALEKSRAALARADAVAYFADARRLDDAAAVAALRARLGWVRSLNDATVTLYASRGAEDDAAPESASDGDESDDEAKAAILRRFRRDGRLRGRAAALRASLGDVVERCRTANVVRAGHGPGGSRLDVEGLFSVLLSLLAGASRASDDGAGLAPGARLLASHVFEACAAASRAGEVAADGAVEVRPWVARRDFADYVGDRDPGSSRACCAGAVDVAAQLALPKFDAIARDLCARGVLVAYGGRGHGDVAVVVERPGESDAVFAPDGPDDDAREPAPPACALVTGAASEASAPFACRAPFHPRLRELLHRCVAHGLVLGARDAFPAALEPELEAVRAALDADLDAAVARDDARRALFLAEEVLAVAALRSDDPASSGELRRPARADAARASGNGAAIPEGARIVRLTSG